MAPGRRSWARVAKPASYIGRILSGIKPADLPVQQAPLHSITSSARTSSIGGTPPWLQSATSRPSESSSRSSAVRRHGCAEKSDSWQFAWLLRLHELGWIEGRTVAIEYRWAEGRNERYAEIGAEFVRIKVDVIVTSGTAIVAAKRATAVIPIVFAVAVDPLGTGLVDSLARPGGNVTGLSAQSSDLGAKRLELLREVSPHLRRLAIMVNIGYPAAALELHEVQASARVSREPPQRSD
jgi:hypothetical protein